jgi:tRNA-2-methylthio-N6-dimethylallyladenosine synthase
MRMGLQMSSTTAKPDLPSLANVPYRISQLIDRDSLESVRFRFISVATEQVAIECRSLLASGQADFSELAKSLSLDELTKENGGMGAWVDVGTTSTQANLLYPAEVVNKAAHMNKGDIAVVAGAEERFHVVQLIDAQMRLSPQLTKRRRDAYLSANNLPLDQATNLTYYIDTMGCQMNVADSERMEGQLLGLGMTRTTTPHVANQQHQQQQGTESKGPSVVILNTCSIRDHAEQKVYSYLGPHALRKRRGEQVAIVVAGCVAQQEGERLIRRFPEIDLVMGPQYAPHLTELLTQVADGHQVVATDPILQSDSSALDGVAASPSSPLRRSDVTAFVNVIFGCNERCTYCVVPSTRGVEQSRPRDTILAEIQQLVAAGYKEVTLLGQNIDSWGRDFTPKQRFADLLDAVGKVPGLQRVRFLTSHPKYMSLRVVQAVASNAQTIMPNFNVPFQSGSNAVLRNMRRGYSRERYLEIIQQIKNAMPDASITADCIVGFPGETEEDFQETLSLMEAVGGFDVLNTAAYSARPHTPAADWEEQPELKLRVEEEVKQQRLQRINALGEAHALERSRRFLGRVMPILVEDVSPKNPLLCVGRNPHSRLTYFPGDFSKLKGKVVDVEITEAKAYSLVGRLAD